jgi:hypothetical protein
MTLRDFFITMMQKRQPSQASIEPDNEQEYVVSLDYHFYINASSAQKAYDFAYYMVAPPTFEGQTDDSFCGSEITVYDSDTMEWIEIDTPSE